MTEPASDHERSKCIFPASVDTNALSKTGGCLSAELSLLEKIDSPCNTTADFASAVGVAWALTLQCFIVADVFTFAWHSFADAPLQNNGELHRREYERVCIVHIDQADSVCGFVHAFSSVASSASSKVLFTSRGGSRHHCNTAVAMESVSALPDERKTATRPTMQADLSLTIFKSDCSPSMARLDYRTHHTSNDMATSVLEIFHHIFTQILDASSNSYVRDVERCPREHRAIIKAATTFKAPAVDSCVHNMIIETCERYPQSLAIVSPEGDFTYRELNTLSAKLSLHLQKLGVKPEIFVLCCFNKSAWAIVAWLAILRAGGAYISVHADNPPSYVGSVLQQTNAQILLTDEAFAASFTDLLPHMVVLGSDLFSHLKSPAHNVVRAGVTPNNACLVLFTSGSTGKPKGIVQTHRSYATGITNYARDLYLSDDTRYLQFDDYAFDISNIEFLTPLILGGCCVVPNRMTSMRDLAFEINSKNANIVFLTPTIAIRLDPLDVLELRNLCIGGEPLSRELIAKWENSKTRLLCQYGMGEIAVVCALNRNLRASASNVLGRASTGSIWIADPLSIHKLMPIGSCGEIIIEGPHLARGYLDFASAKRSDSGFLDALPSWMMKMHPDRVTTTRLYRSGDLGRLNFDGTISYLERKDKILKLDGCRIDAREIEHLARKCLCPEDTVIVDLLSVPGSRSDPSLTAIVHFEDMAGSRGGDSAQPSGNVMLYNCSLDPVLIPKIDAIKRMVAHSLPPYMVPTLFLCMNAVPRTSSKKIDRKKIRQCAQTWYVEALEEARSKTASGPTNSVSLHTRE